MPLGYQMGGYGTLPGGTAANYGRPAYGATQQWGARGSAGEYPQSPTADAIRQHAEASQASYNAYLPELKRARGINDPRSAHYQSKGPTLLPDGTYRRDTGGSAGGIPAPSWKQQRDSRQTNPYGISGISFGRGSPYAAAAVTAYGPGNHNQPNPQFGAPNNARVAEQNAMFDAPGFAARPAPKRLDPNSPLAQESDARYQQQMKLQYDWMGGDVGAQRRSYADAARGAGFSFDRSGAATPNPQMANFNDNYQNYLTRYQSYRGY